MKTNTTKANMHPQLNILQHKINTEKLKPGLVASYDSRPGNKMGLIWKDYKVKSGSIPVRKNT